jgi:hypothetical protein
MCVYVFQGLTVGWWKEERHSSDTTARSAGFKSRPNRPPMDVAPHKEKERKNKPTARYLIDQEWSKGKGYKKKTLYYHDERSEKCFNGTNVIISLIKRV